MRNKILFFTLIIFCCSCTFHPNRKTESNEKGLFSIDFDNVANDPDDVLVYSSLYKGVKIVFLETNRSCLIGRISKIRVFENYFYILDSQSAKSLYVFDKVGSFIRKIGDVGNGPGEYVIPKDFTIDNDKKIIYLLDDRSHRINKYDLATGRFISAVKLDNMVRSHHLEFVQGNLFTDAYFDNHSDENYLLRCIQESSGKETSNYLNVMEYNKGISNTFGIPDNIFNLRENGNVVFTQMFMDHIVEITKDSIRSLVELKGKDLLTSDEIKRAFERTATGYINELRQLNKFFYVSDFIEHKNWMLFHVNKGYYIFKVLIDKQSDRNRIFLRSRDDLLKQNTSFSLSPPLVGCYDNYGVYCYINTQHIADYQAAAKAGVLSPDLDRLEELKNLEEDANPVIFYYEFKD